MHRETGETRSVRADDRAAEVVTEPVIDVSADGRDVELLQRRGRKEREDVALPVCEGGVLVHGERDGAEARQRAGVCATFAEFVHVLWVSGVYGIGACCRT